MKRYSNRRSPNGGLNTSTLSDHVSNSESSGSSQSGEGEEICSRSFVILTSAGIVYRC